MAVKTFPYAVIYNGTLYPANTPVKMNEVEAKEKEVTEPTSKKAVNKNDKGTSRKA